MQGVNNDSFLAHVYASLIGDSVMNVMNEAKLLPKECSFRIDVHH
jgi:hypothetical protein